MKFSTKSRYALRLMAELMAEAGYSSVFPTESPENCF